MHNYELGQRNAHRIKAIAGNRGLDTLQLGKMTAIERLIFRLSTADQDDRFALKGGMAIYMRADVREHSRPTTDADIHFHDGATTEEVVDLMNRALEIEGGDGAAFEVVKFGELKHSGDHPGLRFRMVARFGPMVLPFHIDVGFGGRKDPNMVRVHCESAIKGMPGCSVLMVPLETSYAEKLDSVVLFGTDTTRIKDFHDLYTFARSGRLDTDRIADAIERTFEDRGHDIPLSAALLPALSDEFAVARQSEWTAFLREGRRTQAMPADFRDALDVIRAHASEALYRLAMRSGPAASYRPAA